MRVVGEDIVIPPGSWDREVKSIGARWSQRAGAWTLPATRLNAQLANDVGMPFPPVSVDLRAPGPVSDPRLYAYQRDAAGRLATAPHGQVAVMSPGLGKTVVAIAAADLAVPDDQVVVVTISSLTRTWEREVKRWATIPGDVYVMEGKVDIEAATSARWIIVSWDKAAREKDLWGKGWRLFILDESVLAKSRSSKRYKAISQIRRGIDRVWLLSGSPTTRYNDDLWAQLNIVWPRAFTSYWRFAERYCVVEETPWARVVSGNRYGRDPMLENSDLIMVVNQEDVLDLPEYLFEPPLTVALNGRQRREYERMRDDFVAELGDGSEVVADHEITRLLKLQQMASCFDGESAKRDALVDVIADYEPPYLVWAHWRETAVDLGVALAELFDTRVVTGELGAKPRDEIIEAYKAGDFPALVLSLGVGKFGHTLTNTKTIVSFDRNFNADDYFQSMHRVRRIGLTHSPVVLPVVAAGTVDELTVGDNLEAKLRGIAKLTRADLGNLLKGMGR